MHFKTAIIAIWAALLMPVLSLAGPVPDTGQAKCYNDTEEIPCPQPGEPFYGQDAQYDGPARSYTKLGQNGVELPDTATQADGWIMTRDNVTGLIWEIKTDDRSIHNYWNGAYWYDSNPDTNGGDAGTDGDGIDIIDTEDFINSLNGDRFGGFSDWRMPTVRELDTLVCMAQTPAINLEWFPFAAGGDYWSATSCYNTEYAWLVNFYFGTVSFARKSTIRCFVRAVRTGQ